MRYLGSFFITFILYASAITTLLYTMNSSFSSTSKKDLKEEIVKISLVEAPVKEIKKEVKKQKRVEEKIEKKVLEKRVEVIKKIKKPKIVKQKIVKKRVEEKIAKEIKKEQINPKKDLKQADLSKKATQNLKKSVKQIDNTPIKEQFYTLVRDRINSNKEYPNSARRRGIQGSVKVKFKITKEGNIKELEILKGKKIFHKSVLNAINRSFPIPIPKELNSFPIIINLELKFNLN